jgi:hypothetical protein
VYSQQLLPANPRETQRAENSTERVPREAGVRLPVRHLTTAPSLHALQQVQGDSRHAVASGVACRTQ